MVCDDAVQIHGPNFQKFLGLSQFNTKIILGCFEHLHYIRILTHGIERTQIRERKGLYVHDHHKFQLVGIFQMWSIMAKLYKSNKMHSNRYNII